MNSLHHVFTEFTGLLSRLLDLPVWNVDDDDCLRLPGFQLTRSLRCKWLPILAR